MVTDKDNGQESAKFIIMMCGAMIVLLLLALFSVLLYHTPYIAMVIVVALLAYAAVKKHVTGIIAAVIGVGLLIYVALQLTPLLDAYLHPGIWQTIHKSLTSV